MDKNAKNGKNSPFSLIMTYVTPLEIGLKWPQNCRKCTKCNINFINHHFISLFLKKIIICGQTMQKMAKMTNFHCFGPTLPPENGSLIAIESGKCIKCHTNQIIHNLTSFFHEDIIIYEQKIQKMAKMVNFHCF